MRLKRMAGGAWAALFLFLAPCVFPAEDNSWLNGKWSGVMRDGGSLDMTLNVNGDRVEGYGVIAGRTPKHLGTRYTITGSVAGKKVTLDLDNNSARSQGGAKLLLELIDGKLTGMQGGKNAPASFRKIDSSTEEKN
jgi:hypothetical protein